MAIWKSSRLSAPPQTEDVAELRAYLKTTINQLAIMMKDLDYVLDSNLDIKNLRANSITAKALSVDELSAITANLGTITAGIIRGIEIYGSKFSTNETGYPKVEISNTENLIRVFYDANNYITFYGENSGSPSVTFTSPSNTMNQSANDSGSNIASEKDVFISSSTGSIYLDPFGAVTVESFDKIYGTFNGESLGTALSNLSDRITALGG